MQSQQHFNFKWFLLFGLIIAVLVNIRQCFTQENELHLGDYQQCGRDCVYYICNRLGQNVTLNEIDEQLPKREDVTFADIREVLEKQRFFCKSFHFDVNNIRGLQNTLSDSYEKICAITALPNLIGADNHFVVIIKCEGTFLTVFDVSNNRTGMIDIANFKGQQITLPVMFVSTQSINYKTVSQLEIIMWFLGIGILVVSALLLYSYFSVIRFQQVCIQTRMLLTHHLSYRFIIASVTFMVILISIILCGREFIFTMYPLVLTERSIDLGEIELLTHNDIYIDIKNRSMRDVSIEDVQVSCTCLEIVNYPAIIGARKSQKIKLELVPLLEGKIHYQMLIVPADTPSIIGKISYTGYQHVGLLPKYQNVGMFEQGEEKVVTCEFHLKDLRDDSFTVTSINMQGESPYFEVVGDLPSQIKNEEVFKITLKHLGNAPHGNIHQSFELQGKGSDSGKMLVLFGNIVGRVYSER
jgi:hypothetical protein